MSARSRIVGGVGILALALLGTGFALRVPWLPHRGQSINATVRRWFAPAPQPTLLVSADLECDWKLDGKPQGHLRAEEVLTLFTSPGQHLVEAKTADGKDEWREVVEVHAPEQRVAAMALKVVRQERMMQEKMTEQERMAAQNAQTAKKLALANQTAIQEAAEETRRASRRASAQAFSQANEAKKRAEEATIDAARRELRAERTSISEDGTGFSISKSTAETQAISNARSKVSAGCAFHPTPSYARLSAAAGGYVNVSSVSWTLADSSIERTTCDESTNHFWTCSATVKGTCKLSGVP